MSTAKISEESNLILNRLHRRLHKSKTALINQALKRYEEQIFLDEINEGYARLKADKKAWEEELIERQELEGTIGDGLNDEGFSLSWLVPNGLFYQELTGEITSGPRESPSFEHSAKDQYLSLIHLV